MDTRGVSLYINSRQRSEGKDMWQSMLVFSVLLPKCSRKFMSQTGKVIRQSIIPFMLATLPVAFLLDPIDTLPQRLQLRIRFGLQFLALNTVGPFCDSLRFQRLEPIIEGAIHHFSMLFGLFPQFRGQDTGSMGFLTSRLTVALDIRQ